MAAWAWLEKASKWLLASLLRSERMRVVPQQSKIFYPVSNNEVGLDSYLWTPCSSMDLSMRKEEGKQ